MLVPLLLLFISLFELNASVSDFKKAIILNKRPIVPEEHIPTQRPGQSLKSHIQEHIGCELCINFWNQVLSNLIQIIGDIGLGGGCSEICGPLRMICLSLFSPASLLHLSSSLGTRCLLLILSNRWI